MARFTLKRGRAVLKAMGEAWEARAKELVDGVVLKVQSGDLQNSIKADTTQLDTARKFSDLTLKISADAVNPNTGFPYAAYHEFYSGRSFLRPALTELFDKRTPYYQGFIRALRTDSLDFLIQTLIDAEWKRGLAPMTALRRINLDLDGGFTTGAGGGIGRAIRSLEGHVTTYPIGVATRFGNR